MDLFGLVSEAKQSSWLSARYFFFVCVFGLCFFLQLLKFVLEENDL